MGALPHLRGDPEHDDAVPGPSSPPEFPSKPLEAVRSLPSGGGGGGSGGEQAGGMRTEAVASQQQAALQSGTKECCPARLAAVAAVVGMVMVEVDRR